MTNNRNILTDAFNNKTLVSFIRGNLKETNVKIVKLQSDDVCNKEFTYETSKGERYSSFENNVEII